MAVDAHCLLPVRGRGIADATQTKQRRGDLASTPHHAIGPPGYVVSTMGAEGAVANNTAASSSRKRAPVEDQFIGACKRRGIHVHPAVLHHVHRLSAEVQQWRRHAVAANAAVARQMRAKDEEINEARWLSWLLQDQARAAHVRAQEWRDAAAASEAVAAALRNDLDHVLRAQALARDEDEADSTAESCCFGSNNNNHNGEEEADDDAATGGCFVAGACLRCGGNDATAVLLPCRHLSACTACAAAAVACPACGTPKAGSVTINLV